MKQQNILIVDDDDMVRGVMQDMLDIEGYHTIAVESGSSAIKMAQGAEFDVLLSDIKMPEMNGLQLVHELRQQNPDMVTILITGYASITTARQAIREGVYDYVVKPFSRIELITAVDSALSRKRTVDDNAQLKWLFGLLQVTHAAACFSKGATLEELIDTIKGTARSEHSIESHSTQPQTMEPVSHQPPEPPRQSDPEVPPSPLTPREREILSYIALGYLNKQIAFKLNVSQQTIKNHVTSILHKLNANVRTEAVVVAIKQGIISVN